MHSSSVVVVLCLLAGASPVLAALEKCVETQAVYFEHLFELTSTSEGLYSFEMSCASYMNQSRSSTSKAMYLIDYTDKCEKKETEMTVTERPASLDTSSYFFEFLIQFIFQISIVKKTTVYTQLQTVSFVIRKVSFHLALHQTCSNFHFSSAVRKPQRTLASRRIRPTITLMWHTS